MAPTKKGKSIESNSSMAAINKAFGELLFRLMPRIEKLVNLAFDQSERELSQFDTAEPHSDLHAAVTEAALSLQHKTLLRKIAALDEPDDPNADLRVIIDRLTLQLQVLEHKQRITDFLRERAEEDKQFTDDLNEAAVGDDY